MKQWLLLAIAFAVGALMPASRAAGIDAVCQACTGPGEDTCETIPLVVGAGMTAEMTRFWQPDPSYSYFTDTNITLDYVSFSANAWADGGEDPDNGDTNLVDGAQRTTRSIGHISDALTVGEGGAPGLLSLPLHVAGSSSVQVRNGFGNVSLDFACTSSDPESQVAIGDCEPVQLDFEASSDTLDTVVQLDVPVVLGQPFAYRVTVTLEATAGHGAGTPIPFSGTAQGGFHGDLVVESLLQPSVLDADHIVIPGAPISASESGFVYVPEPSAAASAATAFAAVLALRRRV